MEVPEKIYVALDELTEDGHTLVLDHRVDYPICTEYIRTDAFIEKVCKYLRENCTYIHPRKGTEECFVNLTLLKDFLNRE